MYSQNTIDFAYPPTVMFQADGKSCLFGREPTLRRMPDGSLMSLVYSGGPHEPSDDNFVAVIQSYDDGATWSKPRMIFSSPTHAVWGTELFTETDMPFVIIHTFHAATVYQELNAYRSFTTDNGQTWTPPASIPGVPQGMSIRQGKVLDNGDWIFPVYWNEKFFDREYDATPSVDGIVLPSRFVGGAIRSTDQGRTFLLHGYVTGQGNHTAWEPEIADLGGGRLRMFVRSDGTRSLLSSFSFDYGQTWSQIQYMPIPNPGAKITVYKIAGSHVLFSNICNENEKPHRHRLEAWVSDDNFASWKRKILLAQSQDQGEKTVNITYPHGFADQEKEIFYLAVDSYQFFTLLKIPFGDLK